MNISIKKILTMLFTNAMLLTTLVACGKNTEVTLVSDESKSGLMFTVEYETFLEEEFNLVFADAQDGSYLLSMEVLERPGQWSWEEVLIQCGNANVEEFVLAGISFYDWHTVEVGEGQMEYLSVDEEGVLYSVGVVAMKEANYGVMIYGNFGEDILLKTAQEITVDEKSFAIEMSGLIQNISLSNRGKSLENYKILYFENEAQTSAYLAQAGNGLKLKQIKDGKEFVFAGNEGTAVGYGLDAAGKIFFAGQGQGSVACYGLIKLPDGKGLVLLEYTNRSREDGVESLPKYFEKVTNYFQSKAM